MTVLLTIIHIIVCLFLIAVVLLQSGKGAEMGAAFGGSSQTLFGSRGAASFLSKMTTVAAVVFMVTSLTLAVIASRSGSIIQKTPASQQQQAVPPSSGPVQAPQQQVPQAQPQAAPQVPQQTPSK
jgi:preprotein translocase subunit SecG